MRQRDAFSEARRFRLRSWSVTRADAALVAAIALSMLLPYLLLDMSAVAIVGHILAVTVIGALIL